MPWKFLDNNTVNPKNQCNAIHVMSGTSHQNYPLLNAVVNLEASEREDEPEYSSTLREHPKVLVAIIPKQFTHPKPTYIPHVPFSEVD